MPKIVGIDLGTSTTCAAVVQDGEPSVIPGVRGSRVTPSYIYVMEGGRILVGENAKAEVIADPFNTIWATKRLIGRKFDDPSVQEAQERLPYKISSSQKNEILVHGRDKVFTPVSVASLILKFAIRLASKQMNEPVGEAVITVPASFNDLQRKATKLAGERIGLKVERLVNEPTASALAWGYQDDSERTVAIYDLGGGTFDVSILAIGRGVYEVLATRGDSWLGGEDFDNRLVDYVVESFKRHHQINIYNDKMAHQRVKTAAEQAKIELSVKDSARIYLPSICPDVSKWADVDYTITRDRFESLVEDMVDHTIQTFKGALEDVELGLDELDNVILVGGVTRMPLVRAKLKEFLGREPDHSIDPDEAVALGAAIHAAALAGEKIAIKPAPEAKARKRRKKAADKAAALPEPGEEAVALEGVPDEPAAATDQPAAASKRAPLLIDVLSQSVGIADVAGLFVPLLKRNTKLPARVSQVFTTAMDRQQAIRISVHQGEEKRVKDKVVLGEFVLEGIERAPRGMPQIEVTFNIDHSGIFTVSAKDLKTNVAREIRVEGIQL